MKCGKSGVPLLPTIKTVEIINLLINRYLGVKCKNKNTDIEVQQFNVGQIYSLTFILIIFSKSTCAFVNFV